jgi:hypothetical protein
VAVQGVLWARRFHPRVVGSEGCYEEGSSIDVDELQGNSLWDSQVIKVCEDPALLFS